MFPIRSSELPKEAPPEMPPRDPDFFQGLMQPVSLQIFDDLYLVGTHLISILILVTSEGLVLIDSTDNPKAYEEYLAPGLKQFGLEGERVLALFLTHGHFDHYLGADNIRRNTGCEIGLSEADAAYLVWSRENVGPNQEFKEGFVPRITFLLRDGETYSFGDHSIYTMIGGGHTPGCMNYFFDVHEKGETHRVMVGGGFGIFGPGAYPDGAYPYGVQWGVDQALHYASTSVRAWEHVKQTHCDVYFNPHPHLCNFDERLAAWEKRGEGDPNPFVIGEDGVRVYLADRFRAALDAVPRFTDIERA